MPPADGPTLAFTKHEGAGNDFLVLLDAEDEVRLTDEQVRRLCDRHRGVGADGLIRVTRPGSAAAGSAPADLAMELRNADGSTAEMSGNGIRCLAQAAVEAGLVHPPTISVDTAGGRRTVEYVPGERPGHDRASVDMGTVRLGEDQPQRFADRRARTVDVGNPHLVLLGPDPAGIDVATLGAKVAAVHPRGVNVEFVAVRSPDDLVQRVCERGVGETLACGTGSVAAAAAAHSWGLVGERVRVENPGGVLEVDLGAGPDVAARLAGPVRRVARVVVDADWLA